MKKLLTVLCVAAFGIGAVAQAQVVQADGIIRTQPNRLKENAADIVGLPVMSDVSGQLKDATDDFDTLRWHPEYYQEDCRTGIYSTYYSQQGMFGEEVVPGCFSPYLNGTGEVGATFQTEAGVYDTYAGIDLTNAWVVGAYAIVCRMGNTIGWERVRDSLGIFNPAYINNYNGVAVPDMPFKLIGYPEVTPQRVFKSYTEMIMDKKDPVYITVEMPTSIKDRAETTDELYLRYEPRKADDGRDAPTYYGVGGLFSNKSFSAAKNFGISFCANLTGNKTYDSLWNYNIGAKSNDECSFYEAWSVWQRFDFSNHETNWVGFWNLDESDLDVNLPWFPENDDDPSGFAPPGSPQIENGEHNSLFVYNHCLLRLSEGTHYKPSLYPIIQYRSAANESNQAAYAQTVSVYPLPATDKANIVALDPMRKVEIYNMAGALLKVIDMNENVFELDVTAFTPGAYVAKITTEKGVASKKLVIK
ncbi:T9SS type A sorting domain-containing protein [bacterium]|nr:T9SS type A sorting domain-containing protein [bacterium]